MRPAGELPGEKRGCAFQDKEGPVVLDQIHTVDKSRLQAKLGSLAEATQAAVLQTLQEMFST